MSLWRSATGVLSHLRLDCGVIRISQVRVTDEQELAVLKVLRSGQLAMGRETTLLESDFSAFFGGAECVAVANGTVGLTLALAAAGVAPGSEVVTTAFSFIGTVEAVIHLGARPVFADVELETGNMDVGRVEAVMSERTAAVLPVHLYGRPVQLGKLRRVADAWGVPVIEDACQAIGARAENGTHIGSAGTAVFSFYGSKNITCGEGGLVATSDPALGARVRLLRNHGSVADYEHQVVGYNGRMTDLQAVLLRSEVGRIDEVTRMRRRNARLYDEGIQNVAVIKPPQGDEDGGCCHQYTLRMRSDGERRDLQKWASSQGVETRVYYPSSLADLDVMERLGYGSECPVATALARTVLSLPVRDSLTIEEVQRVIDVVNGWRPGATDGAGFY